MTVRPAERLAGKRVMVAEDEAIIAMAIEEMLRALGCSVVGPALSSEEGRALASMPGLDAAVLDINLGDGTSYEIASLLKERAIPFCFSTGYGTRGLPPHLDSVPVLSKPYDLAALERVLSSLL